MTDRIYEQACRDAIAVITKATEGRPEEILRLAREVLAAEPGERPEVTALRSALTSAFLASLLVAFLRRLGPSAGIPEEQLPAMLQVFALDLETKWIE